MTTRALIFVSVGVICFALYWWSNQPPALEQKLVVAQKLLLENPQEAYETLQRIVLEHPHSDRALMLAADAALACDQDEKAMIWLRQLSERDGLSQKTRLTVAARLTPLLLKNGHLASAAACLDDQLAARPDDIALLSELATLRLKEGRHWEAITLLETQIRSGQYVLDELIMLGSVDEVLEDLPLLERAEQNKEATAATGYARLHEFRGEYPDAIRNYRLAIERNSKLTEAWAGLGRCLAADRQQNQLEEWAVLCPESANSHPDIDFVRAHLDQSRDPQTAVKHLQMCLNIAPNHRQACLLAGRLLAETDAELALRFSERAARLEETQRQMQRALFDETDAEILESIAVNMEALGRPVEAYAWWQALAAYHPQHAQRARENANRLQSVAQATPGLVSNTVRKSLKLDSISVKRTSNGNPLQTPVIPSTSDVAFLFKNEGATVGLTERYYGGFEGSASGLWIYQSFGGGVGIGDFDHDGQPDLYFCHGSVWPPKTSKLSRNRIYLNRRGKAVDATDQCGAHDGSFSQGVAVGDFNNDGFDDIFVANIGSNRLYTNNGDGTFSDQTPEPIRESDEWTTSCLFADVNADGLEDIFTVNYLAGGKPFEHICHSNGRSRACKPDIFAAAADRLFINLGNGQFADATKDSGVERSRGKGLGAVAADFDHNGQLDIFVSNDTTPNTLLMNSDSDRSGTFREQAILRGIALNNNAEAEACMGIAAADVTGDAQLDLLVTNFLTETNTLYSASPTGFFQDLTVETHLDKGTREMLSFGTQFLDADLDGDFDLVVTNGHLDDFTHKDLPWRMRPQFFENVGGHFHERTDVAGDYWKTPQLGRALARVDWDSNGQPDFVVTDLEKPPALVINSTPTPNRHWLTLKLSAHQSARIATGAIVRLQLSDREIVLHQTAGDGYYCSNEKSLHCGLGDATEVDVLKITWPSEQTQSFSNIKADHKYTAIEDHSSLYPMP